MAIETNKMDKVSRFLGVILLSFLLVAFGSVACKKAGEGETGEEAAGIQEGIMPFEGTVKAVVGKYVFLPEASGFDIVIQGNLESGDIQGLIDKEVRGEGDISPDTPSILIANTLEIKGDTGDWTNVFTRTEEVGLEDFLDLNDREEYIAPGELSYDEKDVMTKLKDALDFNLRPSGRRRIIQLGLDSESIANQLIDLYKNVYD